MKLYSVHSFKSPSTRGGVGRCAAWITGPIGRESSPVGVGSGALVRVGAGGGGWVGLTGGCVLATVEGGLIVKMAGGGCATTVCWALVLTALTVAEISSPLDGERLHARPATSPAASAASGRLIAFIVRRRYPRLVNAHDLAVMVDHDAEAEHPQVRARLQRQADLNQPVEIGLQVVEGGVNHAFGEQVFLPDHLHRPLGHGLAVLVNLLAHAAQHLPVSRLGVHVKAKIPVAHHVLRSPAHLG